MALERSETTEDRLAVIECERSEVGEMADVVALGGGLADDSTAIAVSDEYNRPRAACGEMVEERRHRGSVVVEPPDRCGEVP